LSAPSFDDEEDVVLSLRKFRQLAAAYGADLERWPEQRRNAARQLLEVSAAARSLLSAERELDEALGRVSAQADARSGSADEAEAALLRIRARVAAQLTASAATACRRWRVQPLAGFSRSRWLTVGTLAGAAALAGVLLGVFNPWPAATPDLLGMLQADSISLWAQ
jgi:hypothetical protein